MHFFSSTKNTKVAKVSKLFVFLYVHWRNLMRNIQPTLRQVTDFTPARSAMQSGFEFESAQLEVRQESVIVCQQGAQP